MPEVPVSTVAMTSNTAALPLVGSEIVTDHDQATEARGHADQRAPEDYGVCTAIIAEACMDFDDLAVGRSATSIDEVPES